MSESWDFIVAGAGHTGLVAAAYLAKAGLSVLALEAWPVIGGNTATEALTPPGFRYDSCSTAHNLIRLSVTLRDNELTAPGCNAAIVMLHDLRIPMVGAAARA